MILRARRYWAGQDIQVPEFLTTSAIRILDVIEGDPSGFMPLPTPAV